MKVLDLFAGLGGWSKVARERGHRVITLDLDPRFGTDLVRDVCDVTATEILEALGGSPDLVLASPPCEGFTVMTIGKNWTRPNDVPPHAPKTESARLALRLVERTRGLLEELEPAYFVIENPRAKLRKLPVVADLERRTVTYCRLGERDCRSTKIPSAWGQSLRSARSGSSRSWRPGSDLGRTASTTPTIRSSGVPTARTPTRRASSGTTTARPAASPPTEPRRFPRPTAPAVRASSRGSIRAAGATVLLRRTVRR